MEKIIDPVSVDLLKAELTPDKKLCDTNKSDNEIYVVNCHNAPNVLQEIGRLREIAFRDSGGGTGASVDLDDFDFKDDRLYQQIVIWDPEASAILGGYRYILGTDVNLDAEGSPSWLPRTCSISRMSSSRTTSRTPSSSAAPSWRPSTRAPRPARRPSSPWTTSGTASPQSCSSTPT